MTTLENLLHERLTIQLEISRAADLIDDFMRQTIAEGEFIGLLEEVMATIDEEIFAEKIVLLCLTGK